MLIQGLLSLALGLTCAGAYEPNWDSLDSRPLPQWFDEAKIGIFMHLGPYSVPAVEGAWFWIWWRQNHAQIVEFMKKNYPPNFTYQDFGPELKLEHFNASDFAELVKASGAKYLVFTSKHHDGFANFPSPFAFGWNSVDVGPKRDVVGELRDAFKKHPDLHFGLYYSLYEWYNPMYLTDKANNFKTKTYVANKMIPEFKYLVTKYAPELIWADGDWEATPDYWDSLELLAWLYNSSPSKETVIVNDRWGKGTSLKHGGYYSGPDRFAPGHLLEHKFENAFTVDLYAWGHRRDININDVMSLEALIGTVASTVSCNGNVLINVGPTREGTIAPIFQERLTQLGSWLKVNGEAIYSTQPWTHQNDSISSNPQVWYTSKQDVVYGIALGWPLGDVLTLGDVKVSKDTEIHLIGFDEPLQFTSKNGKVDISFPNMSRYFFACGPGCQHGYTLKFEKLAG